MYEQYFINKPTGLHVNMKMFCCELVYLIMFQAEI